MSDSDFEQQLYEARFGRKMSYATAESLRNQGDFATKIDRFVIDTEGKLLFVLSDSLNSLVNDANMNKRDGGRLPIDTGFLWHSGASSLNSRPAGPTKGEKDKTYTWSSNALAETLARMKIGDVFYFGWTAEYARVQEARNGFLEGALMKWQSFVDAAVAKVAER